MTTTTTSTECIHGFDDPMWCTPCRTKLGFQSGVDRHRSDCAVIAFETLTGATYDESLALLAAQGRKPGQGTPVPTMLAALAEAGWAATEETGPRHIGWPTTGTYLVAAWKGRKGHFFVISDGTVTNDLGYLTNVRYQIWNVA